MKLKSMVLLGTLAATLLFAACNKDENDAESTVNAQDTTFVNQTSKSNRAEIALGTMALTKGSDTNVRKFAQMMIDEHTTAQKDLTDLADDIDLSVNFQDSLAPDQIAMRNTLLGLSGSSFDRSYMAGQILSHQNTLNIYNSEISGGLNQKVKQFATDKQPSIQSHLAMADSIYTLIR
jgi:putative membrane protein